MIWDDQSLWVLLSFQKVAKGPAAVGLIRPDTLNWVHWVRSQERAKLVVLLNRWAVLHQPELTQGTWHRSKFQSQGGGDKFNIEKK